MNKSHVAAVKKELQILLETEKDTTMQVKIHSIHFDADQKLLDFIQEKMEKLTKFDDSIIGIEVFLKLENRDDNSNKNVEAKVFVPGKDLFAKKSGESFEAATDELCEALQKQVKKHKEKLKEHHR